MFELSKEAFNNSNHLGSLTETSQKNNFLFRSFWISQLEFTNLFYPFTKLPVAKEYKIISLHVQLVSAFIIMKSFHICQRRKKFRHMNEGKNPPKHFPYWHHKRYWKMAGERYTNMCSALYLLCTDDGSTIYIPITETCCFLVCI